jgi:hypothetical protein
MPARDPRVRRASSSLAATVRWHPDADTTEARAGLAAASAKAKAREIVATWPPLSAEVKAELAVIILSGGDRAAT